MSNIKKVVLDNGLTILLNQDNSKRRTTVNIYVNVGGQDSKYIIDNKEKHSICGLAHFLEHYLLEHSIYGNVLKLMSDEYISGNGMTSSRYTNYYFSTVHDFEKLFVIFLNVVNNPIFNQDYVNETIKPIISEINRKNDDKYYKFYKRRNEAMFNTLFSDNLGSIEDIKKVNVNDLKEFYDAFYQPNNQIIFITGNFNDNIIDLIKDTYSKFNKDNKKVEKIQVIENDNVLEKHVKYQSDIKHTFFNIGYKINISNLSSEEKNKLDYYLEFVINNTFNEKSIFFEELYKNKILNFSINTSYYVVSKDYILLSLEGYSDNNEKAISLFLDKMKDLDFDKDKFIKWKNQTILYFINLEEKNTWVSDNYINNVLKYDLYKADDIKFIKNLNIDECKNMVNNVNFDNYTIIENN